MIDLKKLSTETRNPNSMRLDEMSALEIVTVMNQEDQNVIEAVKTQVEPIAKAVDLIADSLEAGGRLLYLGAGTSGRLGVLDAVECCPTFGIPEGVVIGLIAGGSEAFMRAVENSEDSLTLAEEELKELNLQSKDVVVGIAASGRTPYVIGGLKYAKACGCKCVSVACSHDCEVSKMADVAIEAVPGPEVLTGSTRLKAGTCQKLILNMLSTGAMVRIGKAYENLMVSVHPTNQKLYVRAQNIVMEATDASREKATAVLENCGYDAKVAIVSIMLDCDCDEAKAKLEAAKGRVKAAIGHEYK